MWTEEYKNQPPKESLTDWNRKFETELVGDLDYDLARKTCGKFLMHNIGIFVKFLTGFELEPYQRIIIKGWLQKNFTLTVAGRGFSKSFLFAHFCYLYCLMNPGHNVLMTSATFRSSRKVLENIDDWSKRKEGQFLRQTMMFGKSGEMVKKQDMYVIKFYNGATITAVPLGDSNKLRSLRCNVLGVDEGLLIPQPTIDLVLKPFLAAGADIQKKQKIRRREKRLIEAGKMTEEEQIKFKSSSKMIILSSASYQWENLYDVYKRYLGVIAGKEEAEKTDDGVSSYLVHQLSYEAARPELMDPAIIKEIESGMIPEAVVQREYKAQFVQESEGFYSAKKMAERTIPDGKEPTIEVVGDKDAEYILGIDPNVSSSPYNDHFAMCVLKIVDRIMSDGSTKKIGMVVHQYGFSGVDLKFYIKYFYYLINRFNIVYIACDTTSGDNLDFINICNESELFKSKKIELSSLDADFGKENFYEIANQISKSYSRQSNRIVQKQSFHTAFQKAANDHLQTCINFGNIVFAGKALAVEGLSNSLSEKDIMNVNEHPEFRTTDGDESDEDGRKASMYEFIQNQDNMMDLVKRECAMIEMKTTILGTVQYDIPQQFKRSKNPNRPRKDNYSALLLANWALKLYLESGNVPPEEEYIGGALWVR